MRGTRGRQAAISQEAASMNETTLSVASVALALGTGIAIGIVFSLVKLPSPAPPLLGLIGLTGMFIGQRLWPLLAARLFHG
jgi:XapX domain-containing protein